MFHTKSKKDNALHRLKIIRGHLEKVISMVEDDTYCIDVLTQTKALRSSLSKVEDVLLENHLSHCVVDHIHQGRADKAVKEIMNVFQQRKGNS